MFSMVAANILDTKVIHNEYKDDGSPFVAPEAWGGVALKVAVLGQMLSEEIIGKLAGLFQPVDPFGDLEVYPVIEHKLSEVVLVNEFLGNLGEVDADIFRSIEGSAQVKVGEVVAGEMGIRGG